MAKDKINLNKPNHQLILVKLTLMFYAAGDVKDVYGDEELYQLIQKEFGILNDKAMGEFLGSDGVRNYYEKWGHLKVMPNEDHLPPEEVVTY